MDEEAGPSTYTIRPKFEKKYVLARIKISLDCVFGPYTSRRFRPALVNQMVGKVLKEALADKQYSGEEAKQWSKEICDTLQANLKGLITIVYHHDACALQ